LSLHNPFLLENEGMPPESKYARIEWERRFLLAGFPKEATVTRVRRITDHYIEGTALRMREQRDQGGEVQFKLTQKLGAGKCGSRQGLITTMYLTKDEYRVFANLPARILTKTRSSMPPFGIDEFEGALRGLVLAEAEFDSDTEASALDLPSFIACEVSEDVRFTGGRLVKASRQELEGWLAEYGIKLKDAE
jgi:CYTH domain-containing protein